ncbi:hypothetical protein NFI96_022463 [Prochilodus magdalenae]|nr:hypothetical protein NFI96_022463 [Prochilodus magdalenae]
MNVFGVTYPVTEDGKFNVFLLIVKSQCEGGTMTSKMSSTEEQDPLKPEREYKTKETGSTICLGKRKRYTTEAKECFFEQRLPPRNTQEKEKAFSTIRKALKEKGLRFQTLYPAKLRVFFDDGPAIYNNASEAREDLMGKGEMDSLDVEVPERGALLPRE